MVKGAKREKPKGETVHANIPKEQYDALCKLDGVIGVGINGVVANILNAWLLEQEWFREIIRKKIKP